MLKTLCLAVMWWLLSQCRYWSVCVGFLYTEVLNVLSGCIVTSVSKKGNDPCCVGSTVNWMCGSWLLMCCSKSWLCSALMITNVSSTDLSQREGELGKDWRALTSNSSMKMLAMRGLMGDPIAAPCAC